MVEAIKSNFQKDISEEAEQDENLQKQKKLLDFIKSIANKTISDDNIKDKADELFNIYDETFRHSYSSISNALLNKHNEELTGIADNLRQIITYSTQKLPYLLKEKFFKNTTNVSVEILKKIISNDSIEKELKDITKNDKTKFNEIKNYIEKRNLQIKKIFKLADHIDLEMIRHKYISEKYGKEIENIKNKAIGLENNLENKANKLEKDIEQSKKDLENSKINYVTILGIFSAIMISFTSGLVFSKEVIENTSKNNIYATIISISSIAIFIGTIIFALFLFIQKINNNKSHWTFNLCILIFYIFFIYIFLVSLNQVCDNDILQILKFW